MDEEKKWMLMTYYCPTHGDSGLVKPIQITKKEISKTFLKKSRSSKNYLLELLSFFKKVLLISFFVILTGFTKPESP